MRTGTTQVAAVAVIALLAVPISVRAQVQLGLRAGVIAGSNLLTDSIVEPLQVRPNPAAYVGITVDTRLDRRHRVGLAVLVSRSDVVRREAGEEAPVTTLTVWHPAATVRRDLGVAQLEASLGVLVYNPRTELGTIFQDGAPVHPVVGLGVTLAQRIGGRLAAGLELRYDLHRFSTAALSAADFSGRTTVHRIAIGASIRRTHARQAR